MKSALHNIADERVDVYKENEEFSSQLEDYYKSNDKSIKDKLWFKIFRASCNFIKKRFGAYWKYEEIEELALNITIAIFTRIDNRTKFKDGYKIINLPKTIENVFLTIYYNNAAKFERKIRVGLSDDYRENISSGIE